MRGEWANTLCTAKCLPPTLLVTVPYCTIAEQCTRMKSITISLYIFKELCTLKLVTFFKHVPNVQCTCRLHALSFHCELRVTNHSMLSKHLSLSNEAPPNYRMSTSSPVHSCPLMSSLQSLSSLLDGPWSNCYKGTSQHSIH